MHKIVSTVFNITKEEIEEIASEMIVEGALKDNFELNEEQIIEILACVEGDEMLAKDIRSSIRGSIMEVLEN